MKPLVLMAECALNSIVNIVVQQHILSMKPLCGEQKDQ